jgi:hypothetical protein
VGDGLGYRGRLQEVGSLGPMGGGRGVEPLCGLIQTVSRKMSFSEPQEGFVSSVTCGALVHCTVYVCKHVMKLIKISRFS